jgi:serine protease
LAFALLADASVADSLPLRVGAAKPRLTVLNSTDRLIVRFKDEVETDSKAGNSASASADRVKAATLRSQPMSGERQSALSAAARMHLAPVRRTGGGAHVVRMPQNMLLEDAETIIERIKQDPSVAHAEVDRRRLPLLVPSDTQYAQQWNLKGAPGGIDAESAWNVTQGSGNTVVAVLDTGILRNHRDLAMPGSRLLPGYDFVSADPGGGFATANDGNGRDADPADPGDFVSATEAGKAPFAACPTPLESSWHGTHIAGIIAANGNNAVGTAGINWNTRILPVRVLGKCGGYTSDTSDAIRWAAGLPVPNVPNNPTPAQVINLSLGGPGACTSEEQSAINAALNASVRAIVAAAGNDAGASTNVSPANCSLVITVTGTDRNGSRAAAYANIGANVAVAAPGGFFTNAMDVGNGILSLSNTGVTVPVADALAYVAGTSEAAAHVSGVVSLMLAINPNLSPYQVYWVLRGSARRFPDATCTTSTCGAGIADAAGAVQRASAPPPNPAGGGVAFTPAPASQPGTPMTPTTPVATPVTMPPGGATAAAPGSTSGTTSGGDGGGGCTMSASGEPEWMTLALACLALFRIARQYRRRATARSS